MINVSDDYWLVLTAPYRDIHTQDDTDSPRDRFVWVFVYTYYKISNFHDGYQFLARVTSSAQRLYSCSDISAMQSMTL